MEWFVGLGGAAMAAVSPPSAAHSAAAVDIASILSGPKRYEGRLVTLSGVIDQCTNASCHLCEETPGKGPRACITLGHWSAAATTEKGQESQEAWRATAHFNELYRFATVRLTARVEFKDPAHEASDHAEEERMDEAAMERGLIVDRFPCMPGRNCREYGDTWLEDVTVGEIIGRTSPLQGVLSDRFEAPLQTVPPSDLPAMLAALPSLYSPQGRDVTGQGPFGPKGFIAPNYVGAWVCLNDDGEDGLTRDWPTRLGHLLPTPARRYECFHVDKDKDGVWRQTPGNLVMP